MSYFKLNCDNFKTFIFNSRIMIENSLYGVDSSKGNIKSFDDESSVELRIINNLDTLTQEEKIIWSKESDSMYRGVVLENCTFSDYTIVLYREQIEFNSDSNQEMYSISFMKDFLTYEKIEYFGEALNEKDNAINNLLETVDRKLLQQQN